MKREILKGIPLSRLGEARMSPVPACFWPPTCPATSRGRHRRERRNAHSPNEEITPPLISARLPKGGRNGSSANGVGYDAIQRTLAERAYRIRRNARWRPFRAGLHRTGLDISDVLAAYFHALRYRPEDPHWEERDRFCLSIGHYAIALYSC